MFQELHVGLHLGGRQEVRVAAQALKRKTGLVLTGTFPDQVRSGIFIFDLI
jgi:hypothetical protein